MIINSVLNIFMCTIELYIVAMLAHKFYHWPDIEYQVKAPKRNRMMLLCLLILQTQCLAAGLYDVNGPGDHFPLQVRIPIMIVQAIIILCYVL